MSGETLSGLSSWDCLASFLGATCGVSKSYLKRCGYGNQVGAIRPRQSFCLPLDLLNYLQVNPNYQGPRVPLLFENDLFLVLDKPSGIHSHPHRYSDQMNCLSAMRSMGLGKNLNINSSSWDRGLLYRLDEGTSGVLIYAKNEKLYKYLRENFSTEIKEKKYFAKVHGHLQGEGELHHYLRPFGEKGAKLIAEDLPRKNTQEAFLFFKAISYDASSKTTLVEVNLKTGVRHQIRCQLAKIGHPIMGDLLYGGLPERRSYLHCACYKLTYEGTLFEFHSPLPW